MLQMTQSTKWQVSNLSVSIHQQQLRWLGHVIRKPPAELISSKNYYINQCQGSEERRLTIAVPQYDMLIHRNIELTLKEIILTAKGKVNWTQIVTDCSAACGCA